MKFTRVRYSAACNYTMANKKLEQVQAQKHLRVLRKIYHGSHTYLLLLQIKKMERVQRNVTRWVLGKNISCEERNKPLKLQSLHQRREFLGLVQLFKYIKGNSVSNIDDYMSFINCRRTRNSHNYKLFKPYCRTDIFKNSFWNRHIDKWDD